MSSFPGSPLYLRAGLVAITPGEPLPRVIAFQYNPTSLTRTLEVKNGEGGGVEALRLYGAPVETIKLEAELDATDALEAGSSNAKQNGLHGQLAALELLCYPKSAQVIANTALLATGAMEIMPPRGPLVLFVWGLERVLPVQIREFSITEEAYDPWLNPIRARVSLGLRVLSYDDLPAEHEGHSLFLAYQIGKEIVAESAIFTNQDVLETPR